MNRKSWVAMLLFCMFFFQLVDSEAQKIQRDLTLSWKNNVIYSVEEDDIREFLCFDGAVHNREFPTLPLYYEQISVDNFYQNYHIIVSNVQFEALSSHDCSLIPQNFNQTELQIKVVSAYERSHPYALLSFIPIVKISDGQYKRVKSLTVKFSGYDIQKVKGTKEYAAQSVLASGKWYKFSINQTGVFKVTFKDMQQMGISGNIPSNQIALFGNGGGMLPESNAVPRIDDLQEIPIQIYDGGDGVFNDEDDYFIFYGESPHTWIYDTSYYHFSHSLNVYSDAAYYFITITPGLGQKKRVQLVNNTLLTVTQEANTYTHYDFKETDRYNLSETGKMWLGDLFDVTTSYTYNFSIPAFRSEIGRVTIAAAGVSPVNSALDVKIAGVSSELFLPAAGNSVLASLSTVDYDITPTDTILPITLSYNKPTASSSAYLDWIEIEMTCDLTMHSAQFPFCNPHTVQPGSVTQFSIRNYGRPVKVWDVTNPGETYQMVLASGSGTKTFKVPTDILRKFYAFDGTSYLKVKPMSQVGNQNLHGTSEADLIIITHPDFKAQANRLADFRRKNDGLSVKVATIQQVYNEFSSGSQDPIAIRDYMKMIYDKSNHQYPKYLLLVGRPCYDYRGRVQGTKIFVPNYQYAPRGNAISEYDFYSNDDSFGLLDDSEGENAAGLYDLPIGRFPCSTPAQAKVAVDKSINYTTRKNLVAEGSTTISNLGDWRNVVTFVADDEDMNDFVINADLFATILEESNANLNFDKIYLDAYRQESNAGGQRYPEVNTAINNRMNRGSLFFTYIGHSGKDGWAVERVLENSDINKWTNKYNQPIMLTLSCSFGYYDRPAISPAELILFNPQGGAAGLITTTREAWSSPNNTYGRYLFSYLFNKEDYGRYPTVGEIQMHSKNLYGGAATTLAMIVLMGDPSMPLAIPKYRVITDSINHCHVSQSIDTLKALSKVTIHGRVVDDNNQTLDGFNGAVFPSIYDKAVMTTTLANDPESEPFEFKSQKNLLFRGNHSVNNGHFSFSFYIPKDIDYDFGNGKISYYARSHNTDAAGAFTDFIIGGTDTNGLNDQEGPTIELYLNDENFVSGGITDPNPVLIAKIKDNYGINTTGNGIGHDLTAILDNATDAQIVLNDYYETAKDSSNMGTVRYQLADLKEGKHTLLMRAWDINNNHSESELTFTVTTSDKLQLEHVLNYPNPFTTHTDFFFEHNRPGNMYDIRIQIYTISGKLIRTLNSTQYLEGNRNTAIPWDGRDDYGDKVAKGTYLYRLSVRNENGETAEKIEKLVIL